MEYPLSDRISHVPPSFLREIFKIIADPNIISFAGGLPNADLFPTDAFRRATEAALREAPHEALQYGATEGLPELREIIAASYAQKDTLTISPERILITNGSQQGLDLIGKVFVNPGDTVVTESPAYLAALQSFSLYQPVVRGVPLQNNGMNIEALKACFADTVPKLLYTIPNFQNPTGITYSAEVRAEIAALLRSTNTILIEDDPYGEIRFSGVRQSPFASMLDTTLLLGTFSKIIAPGLRLGWIVAPDDATYRALATAKQASDLHTSTLIQHIVYRYYRDNDSDAHVAHIASAYKKQKDTFCSALTKHFSTDIDFVAPDGGMFIWATLPEHIDTAKLFSYAVDEGVAFVPGESFYIDEPKRNTMRLNFTNASDADIEEGISRLRRAVDAYERV